MSASIVSRTISALVDKKLVLGNDQAARLLGIGTTWTKIRFGLRLAVDPQSLTSDLVGPDLRVGLCSGVANKVGDATTDNFIGFRVNNTLGYTAPAGPVPAYLYAGGAGTSVVCKKVGTTLTNGGNINAWGVVNDTAFRTGLIIQIEKGSPNYTVSAAFAGSSGIVKDLSYVGLLQALEADTIANASGALNGDIGVSGYTNSSVTLAFDEVAGALNAFNIYWSIASRPLEISEVLYARIA